MVTLGIIYQKVNLKKFVANKNEQTNLYTQIQTGEWGRETNKN